MIGHRIQKECANLKIHPATKDLFSIISKNNMAQIEGLWTELQNRTAERMLSTCGFVDTSSCDFFIFSSLVPGCLQQAWWAVHALWRFSFHTVGSRKVEKRKIVRLVKLPTIALLRILQSNIKARGCINREAKITECCQTKQQLHASRQAAPLQAVM